MHRYDDHQHHFRFWSGMVMIWRSPQTGISWSGKIVSILIHYILIIFPPTGTFGGSGICYQEWLECNVRHCLGEEGRGGRMENLGTKERED